MKKLQSLGTLLSKFEQKKIVGGYGEVLLCKKENGEPCPIPQYDGCPPIASWQYLCTQRCPEYDHSASCYEN